MLSQGNLKAPVLYGLPRRAFGRPAVDRVKSARRCERCHADIYNTYVASIHGNAPVNERNADVPICVDRHTAHTILDARTQDYREKVPEICGRCHGSTELMKKYGLNTGVVNPTSRIFTV